MRKTIKTMTVLERGELFLGLKQGKGKKKPLSTEQIAKKYDMGVQSVYQCIRLASEPKEVQKFIKNGSVTPAEVLTKLRKKMSTDEKVDMLSEIANKNKDRKKALGKEGVKMTTLKKANLVLKALGNGPLKNNRSKIVRNLLEKFTDPNVTETELIEYAKGH
jgi:transcription elongation factor GreA-like protein